MTISIHDFPLSPSGLAEWEGSCMELVNELLHNHPTGDILWINHPKPTWWYHAVLVLDGIVYDPWYPHLRLPPADYVLAAFGDDVEWEINPGYLDDLRDEWEASG